eukprot:292951-Hanusia_phi.AAC.1
MGHTEQTPDVPVVPYPSWHTQDEEELLADAEVLFVPQATQALEPTSLLYVPTAHATQRPDVVLSVYPTLHMQYESAEDATVAVVIIPGYRRHTWSSTARNQRCTYSRLLTSFQQAMQLALVVLEYFPAGHVMHSFIVESEYVPAAQT